MRYRLLQRIDAVLFHTAALLLGVLVGIVVIQVVFRYILQDPPPWTEELARYIAAWLAFIAAPVAFGRRAHIVVGVLVSALPARIQRLVAIVTHVVTLGFLCILVWYGTTMARLTSDTIGSAIAVNIGAVYAALPVGAAISVIFVSAHLLDAIRGDLGDSGHSSTEN